MNPEFPTHLALILALLFAPGVLASLRRHRNSGAIWITNVLAAGFAAFAWPIGLALWLIALIWAAKASDRRTGAVNA